VDWLRFGTFLGPNILPVYQAVAEEVGLRLGIETELVVETDYESCAEDRHEVCFVCSLVCPSSYDDIRMMLAACASKNALETHAGGGPSTSMGSGPTSGGPVTEPTRLARSFVRAARLRRPSPVAFSAYCAEEAVPHPSGAPLITSHSPTTSSSSAIG
jgi:hypothetical protein